MSTAASTDPAEAPPASHGPAPVTRLGRRSTLRFFGEVIGPDPLPALAGLPGGNSIVKIPSIGTTVVVVRHPEHVRHVLVTAQDRYVKGIDYRILAVLLGNGLLTNTDPVSWQRNRSLVQPLFARRHLAPMAEHMVSAAGDWLDALDAEVGDGAVLDASEAMMALTLDVVGRALFGQGIDGSTTKVVGESMTAFLRGAAAMDALTPFARVVEERTRFSFEDLMHLRWRHWSRVMAHKQQMDEIVHGLIDARLASDCGTPDGDDLLSLLLAARDERGDDGMDREQVRDEVMTFLAAGHETTANAMAWMWMLLSQHPEARRRLEAEVDELLAGRRPTLEDVERLPWTNAVLQESMRLCPPVPAFSRFAASDDTIDGVRIRRGSFVVVAPYLLHRDPEFWDNPEGFDPERFMPGAAAGRPRQSYMPFGGGRRVCVGQGFALVEGVLLAAMTAQRFRLDLVPGVQIRREVAVTMRPRDGLPMRLLRR